HTDNADSAHVEGPGEISTCARSTKKSPHLNRLRNVLIYRKRWGRIRAVSTGRSPKADSRLAPRYHVQRNQWSCLAAQELAAAWLCRSFHPYARMRSVLMMRIGTPSSSAGTAPCMRPVST